MKRFLVVLMMLLVGCSVFANQHKRAFGEYVVSWSDEVKTYDMKKILELDEKTFHLYENNEKWKIVKTSYITFESLIEENAVDGDQAEVATIFAVNAANEYGFSSISHKYELDGYTYLSKSTVYNVANKGFVIIVYVFQNIEQ